MQTHNGAPIEGVPIEIKFGKNTDIIYLHPDGAIHGDSLGLQLKVDSMQRAAKHFQRIERLVSAGTIDEDEFDEQQAALDKAKAEELVSIEAQQSKGEISSLEATETKAGIEKQYRAACKSLLNARDGEPVDADENARLTVELEKWRMAASVKPIAVPFLRSCLVGWTLHDGEGKPTPITHDTLRSLNEDWLTVAFGKASAHYRKEERDEKKLNENSLNGSQMKTDSPEASLNGSGLSALPNDGGDTPMRSSISGDNEHSAAV